MTDTHPIRECKVIFVQPRLLLARHVLSVLREHVVRVALQLVERRLVVYRACLVRLAAGCGCLLLSIGLALWLWGLTALVWCRHVSCSKGVDVEVVGLGGVDCYVEVSLLFSLASSS